MSQQREGMNLAAAFRPYLRCRAIHRPINLRSGFLNGAMSPFRAVCAFPLRPAKMMGDKPAHVPQHRATRQRYDAGAAVEQPG